MIEIVNEKPQFLKKRMNDTIDKLKDTHYVADIYYLGENPKGEKIVMIQFEENLRQVDDTLEPNFNVVGPKVEYY